MRQYPATRLRRLRQAPFIRHLVQETRLHPHDLIYPVFVTEGRGVQIPIQSMPGQYRYSLDTLLPIIDECVALGIQAIALFPVVSDTLKTEMAEEAYNPHGLIPNVIKALKDRHPGLGIITDVALDPYTSHGQDGITDAEGNILNDVTVEVLQQQALCHANAGADIIAPSDMMDGRIGKIRQTLENNNHPNTMILSYAAKYASSFYGPFREAVDSQKRLGKADKKTYQMDIANKDEALTEVALDLAEGADIVMVKPAMPYLDVLAAVKETFKVPTFAYHVSGEYAMLQRSIEAGILDKSVMIEALVGIKRAGADAILTYAAPAIAKEITRW